MTRRLVSLLPSLVLAGVASAVLPAVLPAQQKEPDVGKRIVEQPIKDTLRGARDRPGGPALTHAKVAPGRVAWHRSFDAAKAAAAKSGKPVLLFQLLGKLDDEFC